jgi:hypothetical protein
MKDIRTPEEVSGKLIPFAIPDTGRIRFEEAGRNIHWETRPSFAPPGLFDSHSVFSSGGCYFVFRKDSR